jgi:hypothetical protein
MPVAALGNATCLLRRLALPAVLLTLAACGSTPGKSTPRDLSAARATAQKASALPVPASFSRDLAYSRAVFIVSPGAGGVGMMHRQPGTRQFSGPSFYSLTRLSASTGGAGTGFARLPQDRELIAAFMTTRSLERMQSPSPSTRNDLRVVTAAASQAERAGADVILLDLDAPQAPRLDFDLTVITIDAGANQAWYGKAVTPAEIFAAPDSGSADAQALQQSIAALSQEKRP